MNSALRILVIRLTAMGDIVLTTPVYANLRHCFPDAHISVLTDTRFASLLNNNPHINTIISVNQKNISDRKEFHHPFDMVFDLHRTIRSFRWRRYIKTKKMYVYRKHSFARRAAVLFKIGKNAAASVKNSYLNALRKAGVSIHTNALELFFSPDEKSAVEQHSIRITGNNPADTKRPLIALAPGAHWNTKQWPYFTDLVRLLTQKYNARFLCIGGSDEFDYAHALFPDTSMVANLCGKLTPNESAYALSKADILITNDTGSMHLADAVGTPLIALFGPTVQRFGFFPSRETSHVMQAQVWCRPCSLHGTQRCPLTHHRCMTAISVENVIAQIHILLTDVNTKRSTV